MTKALLDEPTERLDKFDSDEWFDVMRRVRPGLSRIEFNELWGKFQRDKAEHQRKAQTQ